MRTTVPCAVAPSSRETSSITALTIASPSALEPPFGDGGLVDVGERGARALVLHRHLDCVRLHQVDDAHDARRGRDGVLDGVAADLRDRELEVGELDVAIGVSMAMPDRTSLQRTRYSAFAGIVSLTVASRAPLRDRAVETTAHDRKRAAQQPRDVHLGDADTGCDFRLGQPLEEPQLDDRPLSLVERLEAGLEQRAVLDLVVPRVGPAEEILDGALVVLAEPEWL